MPKVFGIEHFLFIAAFLILSAAGIFLSKKYCKTKKSTDFNIKITAALLLAAIMFNRISIAVVARDPLRLIPDSFCGSTSLVFSLCALLIPNKNHAVFHCLVYIAFVGGLLSTIYPDYIGQKSSVWHSRTISGLLHHAICLYLVVLLFVTGSFKPSLKKWYFLPLGLCAYITFGVFAMQVLKVGNPMNINEPLLANSPFTWYFVGFLLLTLQVSFLVCYELINKKMRLKADISADNKI